MTLNGKTFGYFHLEIPFRIKTYRKPNFKSHLLSQQIATMTSSNFNPIFTLYVTLVSPSSLLAIVIVINSLHPRHRFYSQFHFSWNAPSIIESTRLPHLRSIHQYRLSSSSSRCLFTLFRYLLQRTACNWFLKTPAAINQLTDKTFWLNQQSRKKRPREEWKQR